MLQNEYLVAIVAVHTAENEPSKVCLSLFCLYLVLSSVASILSAFLNRKSDAVRLASAETADGAFRVVIFHSLYML